jgi:hypothetical protein
MDGHWFACNLAGMRSEKTCDYPAAMNGFLATHHARSSADISPNSIR